MIISNLAFPFLYDEDPYMKLICLQSVKNMITCKLIENNEFTIEGNVPLTAQKVAIQL